MKTCFLILIRMKKIMIKTWDFHYQTMRDKAQIKNLWQKRKQLKKRPVIIKLKALHLQNYKL